MGGGRRIDWVAPLFKPRYPLARLSPAKGDLMVVSIPRAQVLDCDPAPALQQLDLATETADLAERWEGRLGFVFAGWDDDERHIAEIPEIRAYFAALTEAWPYWLHFGEKVGDTLPRVLSLLCRGHAEATSDGMRGWRCDDLAEVRLQLLRLFLGMNLLYSGAKGRDQRLAYERLYQPSKRSAACQAGVGSGYV